MLLNRKLPHLTLGNFKIANDSSLSKDEKNRRIDTKVALMERELVILHELSESAAPRAHTIVKCATCIIESMREEVPEEEREIIG